MPAYRIYTIGDDGYFSSAAAFVESTDDKVAIEKAKADNLQALEIWDDIRLVARLPARLLSKPQVDSYNRVPRYNPRIDKVSTGLS